MGNRDDDYWQFFGLRTAPFVQFSLSLALFSSKKLNLSYPEDIFLLSTVGLLILYFSIYDWSFSTLSSFADEMEANLGENIQYPAKKVVVHKSDKRLKLIVYREHKDGGIQGIFMDFFMD